MPPSWFEPLQARASYQSEVASESRAALDRQRRDGGFDIYPDGPADVNATIKAYVALRLSGLEAASEPLRRARDTILGLGGIQEANSYVRIGRASWRERV